MTYLGVPSMSDPHHCGPPRAPRDDRTEASKSGPMSATAGKRPAATTFPHYFSVQDIRVADGDGDRSGQRAAASRWL